MGLSDDEWQAPSRLAGWTRAHIATHIARNAEAFETVTKAVITNQKVPHLYPSDELRDRDIERGSNAPGCSCKSTSIPPQAPSTPPSTRSTTWNLALQCG